MKKYIISGVVALLILAAGGTALATIPDSGGVIHGCYKTSTGMLSVVDSPTATCPSGTTSLNWNQTGPQGPAGPGVIAHGQTSGGQNAVCGYTPTDTTFCDNANLTATGSSESLPSFTPTQNALCQVEWWGNVTAGTGDGNVVYGLGETTSTGDSKVDDSSLTTTAGNPTFNTATAGVTRLVSVQAGTQYTFEPWITNPNSDTGSRLYFNLSYVCFGT